MSNLNHALRRQGVTGSEIAKVAGLSRWGGPLEVWAEKVLAERDRGPDTVDQERGHRLEPVLCDWAADDVGLVAAECGTLQSLVNPLIIASPDRLLYRDLRLTDLEAVLEVKSPRRGGAWVNPAEDPAGIDPQYLPQVTWEMAAAGLDKAVVGAFVWGEMWTYRVRLDVELLGLLVGCAEKFWTDYVLTRRPPPADSPGDLEVLRRVYKAGGIEKSTNDPVVEALVADLLEAQADTVEASTRLEVLKAQVAQVMGEAVALRSPEKPWLVTWKERKGSNRTDWKEVALALAERAGISNDDVIKLVDEHTHQGEPTRVFKAVADVATPTKRRAK